MIALGISDAGFLLSCDQSGQVVQTSVSADPTAEQTSPSSSGPLYSMPKSPTAVSITSGIVHALIGGSIYKWNVEGLLGEPEEISQADLTQFSVDTSGEQAAVCDDMGGLVILRGGGKEALQIQLAINKVGSLTWSKDGQRVIASNGKRLVTVDAQSGAIESQVIIEKPIDRVVGWTGTQLWYLDSGARLQRMQVPTLGWTDTLNAEGVGVAWSTDGDSIAALTRSGTIARYQADSGSETARVSNGKHESRSLIAIPKTTTFAFLASNADAFLLGEDGQTERLPIVSALGLRSLHASADGEKLFAVNALGKIVAWNRKQPESTGSILSCDLVCGNAVPIQSDRVLAVSGQDPEAVVVPLSQQSLNSMRVGGPPEAVVVAPDASMVGYADGSDTAHLFSLTDEARSELKDDQTKIHFLCFDSSGTRIATLNTNDDERDEIVLWDTATGESIARTEIAAKPREAVFSNGGGQLAVAFHDGHCEVFTGESLMMLESTPAVENLQTFVFSADDKSLIVSDAEGVVAVQPLLAMGHVKTDQNAIVALRFIGGDPERLIAGSREGRISLWNTANLAAPVAMLEGIAGPLLSCELSPDGRYLCVVYEDARNSVCVWKLADLSSPAEPVKPAFVINNIARNRCAAFSGDSQFVLVGGVDGNVFAWKFDEKQLVATFSRHVGPVLDIQPSEQPGMFYSGGEDQRIKSSQFPSVLPSIGGAPVREIMINAMAFVELSPPDVLEEDYRDPFDAARQALVAGASTTEVLDLIDGDKEKIEASKQILSTILTLETGSANDAEALSRQRRDLFASQRRLAPADKARSLSSFVDGYSNLTFLADTNFKFGMEREFRPVRLMFADRFLYAARTSAKLSARRARPGEAPVDEGDNGALLSWDYRYSRLQAHAWSIQDMSVQELFPLPNSAGVFTVPQMLLFMQDGSSRELPKAASWATSNLPSPHRQFLAVGTEGAHRTESDIMKVFDVGDLSKDVVTPLSQYRGFEGVVTAMAFANHSPSIAFCVRSRAVHRLFIADAETLTLQKIEEHDHDTPWIETDTDSLNTRRNTAAAAGITSLAFSPDDRVLVAHGNYEGMLHKFSQWNLSWNQDGSFAGFRKSSKELENESGPLIQESGSKSIWFVHSPRTRKPERANDQYPRVGESSQYRVLVRVRDGFMVVNLNTNREERKIDYLTTHQGTPLYAVSDDGCWLIMGDDSGLAYVWDTTEGDRYSVTIDPATEETTRSERKPREIPERPAHTGPIVGVAISKPDPGRDYPAFAATFGEENKVKVWELFPILDPEHGLRSKNVAAIPSAAPIRPGKRSQHSLLLLQANDC